jgi:hypothetical protein
MRRSLRWRLHGIVRVLQLVAILSSGGAWAPQMGLAEEAGRGAGPGAGAGPPGAAPAGPPEGVGEGPSEAPSGGRPSPADPPEVGEPADRTLRGLEERWRAARARYNFQALDPTAQGAGWVEDVVSLEDAYRLSDEETQALIERGWGDDGSLPKGLDFTGDGAFGQEDLRRLMQELGAATGEGPAD